MGIAISTSKQYDGYARVMYMQKKYTTPSCKIKDIAQTGLYVNVTWGQTLVIFVLKRKAVQAVELMGEMLRFEKRYHINGMKSSWCQKGVGNRIKFHLVYFIFTVPAVCLGCFMHLMIIPCHPGFFGYWMLPECTDVNFYFGNKIFKAILGLIFEYVFVFLMAHYAMYVGTLTALLACCFVEYLEFIKIHLNCNRPPGKKIFGMYREVTLLVQDFNRLHNGPLNYASTILISNHQVLVLYVLITSYDVIVWPLLVACIVSFVDTIIIVIEVDGNIKAKLFEHANGLRAYALSNAYIMRSPLK